MTVKRRGLGRGLEALLGGSLPTQPNLAPAAGTLPERQADIPVAAIQPNRYQPRQRFDQAALAALAESIRAQGVVQPVVLRPVAGGRYELIAGERRWRAAQLAGLTAVPAVIRAVDDRAALAVALIENIQREDLNPLEEAGALQRLIGEFTLTHEQAAQAVGRSRAHVSNLLRLLELADPVKAQLNAGALEMGHARALLALPAAAQRACAEQVVREHLSVRDTERLVQRWQQTAAAQGKPGSGAAADAADPDIRRLEADLSERLAARVQIRHRTRGRGQLVISYHSLDELDGILTRIR